MKDNTDPRRTHSAVCVTVQMTPLRRPAARHRILRLYVLHFWRTGFGWARWVISNEDITAVVPDSYPQNYAMPVAKILKINSALGDLGLNRKTFLLSSRGACPRRSKVYHLSNDRLWRAPCKGGAFQWVQAPPGKRSS